MTMRCRTADRLSTYRQICAQVAREFGIIACFMCKPFMGVSANGCHHNISLWRGGKDEMKTLGNDAKKLPGVAAELHVCDGRRQHLHARHRRRPASRQDRAQGDRRHRQASRRADRDRLLDGELLSPAVGHRLLGAGVLRLGLPEPHHRPARLGARPLRISRRGRHGEPASDGGGPDQGHGRRAQEQSRSGTARGAQHLSGDGSRQAGEEAADDARRCARTR